MPRVESKIEARFTAHESRSHPSTESAFLKIVERLSRIEAKLEDALGRRAGVRAGE